jgi:hypothetical protein
MTRRKKKKNISDRQKSSQNQINHKLTPAVEEWFTTGRVVTLFALLTMIYTFPLVFRLNGWIMGDYKDFYGDIFWYIWCFWTAKVQLLELGEVPLQFDLICGPYNQTSVFALFKTHVIMIPFTALFNQVASLNIFILLNFILAGFFSWKMIHELTGSKAAGIVPGIAFAFCPYAYARAIAHIGMAPIWVFPFLFYILCTLYRRSNKSGWILLLLALVSIYLFCSPYYYLILPLGFGSWLTAWFINRFIFDFKLRKFIRGAFARVSLKRWSAVVVAAIAMVTGAVAFYLHYLRPIALTIVRPLHWQERFALSWTNYLLPGIDHPLFGDMFANLLHSEWGNTTEATVYLGWVLLLLAVYGLRHACRDWRAWALIMFGFAACLITLGPYLEFGSLKLPMPSLLIHKFAPFLRSIGRYASFVMVALTALAGYGMARLLKQHVRSKTTALAIMSVLTILIAIEYARPYSMTRVPTELTDGPPIYAKLADIEEDAIVFDYPPVSITGNPMGDYFFYQTLHHRKLFNRYDNDTNIPDKFLPFWQDMDYPGSLTDPANLAVLKYFGVDYVVVHERDGTTWLHGRLPELKYINGLELVEDLGSDKLYRLTAQPAKAMLLFDTSRSFYNYLQEDLNLNDTEGFDPPSVPKLTGKWGIGWRTLLEKGSVEVINLTDKPLTARLSIICLSTNEERSIKWSVNGEDVGITKLSNTKTTKYEIKGIELAPHGKALVELESLNGTTAFQSFYRTVNGSAIFSRFELFTTEQ